MRQYTILKYRKKVLSDLETKFSYNRSVAKFLVFLLLFRRLVLFVLHPHVRSSQPISRKAYPFNKLCAMLCYVLHRVYDVMEKVDPMRPLRRPISLTFPREHEPVSRPTCSRRTLAEPSFSRFKPETILDCKDLVRTSREFP